MLRGEARGLGAVTDAEPAKYRGDMGLDRGLGDVEFPSDLLVELALTHLHKDL